MHNVDPLVSLSSFFLLGEGDEFSFDRSRWCDHYAKLARSLDFSVSVSGDQTTVAVPTLAVLPFDIPKEQSLTLSWPTRDAGSVTAFSGIGNLRFEYFLAAFHASLTAREIAPLSDFARYLDHFRYFVGRFSSQDLAKLPAAASTIVRAFDFEPALWMQDPYFHAIFGQADIPSDTVRSSHLRYDQRMLQLQAVALTKFRQEFRSSEIILSVPRCDSIATLTDYAGKQLDFLDVAVLDGFAPFIERIEDLSSIAGYHGRVEIILLGTSDLIADYLGVERNGAFAPSAVDRSNVSKLVGERIGARLPGPFRILCAGAAGVETSIELQKRGYDARLVANASQARRAVMDRPGWVSSV